MKKTFTQWFLVSLNIQLIIVFFAMFSGVGQFLVIPYWILAWALAILLHLPQEGTLSVILAFTLAATIYSAILSLIVVGLKYIKQQLEPDTR